MVVAGETHISNKRGTTKTKTCFHSIVHNVDQGPMTAYSNCSGNSAAPGHFEISETCSGNSAFGKLGAWERKWWPEE